MSDSRHIDLGEVGDVTIARFVDKKILDESVIQEVQNELIKLIEVDGRKKIVLNFDVVEFLSSAALGGFVRVNKIAKADGGKVALCNIRPEIMEVFKITQLHRIFTIVDDVESAISSF